ncbi:MAG TPA: PPK2 family polyphosphate kinase [Candidatus Limnocylindrales bacterium]|nr:PPK2 family polyphosphate kinase [Candidatus Limnocylindrales bacterium]
MSIEIEDFKVPPGKKISLKDYDSAWVPEWAKKEEKEGKKTAKDQALAMISANKQKMVELQEIFWANSTYAMLIVLQGMDGAGKDSVIRHVLSGVNPQGCQVTAFKTPCEEDLDHDFLWRDVKALPERGIIGIFNRSYYEELLIVKVRPEVLAKEKVPPELIGKEFWNERYEDINMFEQHLVRNGTVILKFFLNASKERQKERLLARLDKPDKNWKFSLTDFTERSKWNDYMAAYEEMLNMTSTEWAPWYVIPADKKWVTHAVVSLIILSQIKKLNLKYPVLSKDQQAEFEKVKAELEKE